MYLFLIKDNRLYVIDYDPLVDGIISIQNFYYDKQKNYFLYNIFARTTYNYNLSREIITHKEVPILVQYMVDTGTNVLYLKFSDKVSYISVYINSLSNKIYNLDNINSSEFYIFNDRYFTESGIEGIEKIIIQYRGASGINSVINTVELRGQELKIFRTVKKTAYDMDTYEYFYNDVNTKITFSEVIRIQPTHPKYFIKHTDTQLLNFGYEHSYLSFNLVFSDSKPRSKNIYIHNPSDSQNVINFQYNVFFGQGVNYILSSEVII